MTRRLLAILVLLTVACGCMAADATQNAQPVVQKLVGKGQLNTLGPVRKPHKAGAVEASSIAKAFPGEKTRMKTLKYYGREKRRDFQPQTTCHVFEFTHDFTPQDETVRVYDRSAPKGYYEKTVPSPSPKAYVQIEEGTGRVLHYAGDEYTCYKNLDRPRISREDLMPPEQAIRHAERYIHRAGLSMSNMRLTTVSASERAQMNYYHYVLCWKRFVNKPGFGDVEYPVTILATLDAQSGEVDSLLCKQHPEITLQITTPKLSREQAEKIALEKCAPERPVLTLTNLMVYVDEDPKNTADPVLAWHVSYYAKDEPERRYLYAIMDANTGKILEFSREHHGE